MQRIYYWDGIVDPRNLSEDYKETIKKLLQGAYRELDLEKLHGHNVYSIRINRSDRLLFTTVQFNDKPHLMVLDVVLNHDYHKSSFLKPGVLRNYLELNGKLFDSEGITAQDFECQKAVEVVMPEETESAPCEYVAAENFKGRFIEFNEDQRFITQHATLPLLINGAAGSGKSCVALSLLTHYTVQHLDDLDRPILYVTESDKLCRSMQNSWHSLPIAQKVKPELVQFKSYRELVCENDQAASACQVVGYTEFCAYIESRIEVRKKQDKAAKLKSFPTEFFKNKDVLYQEMRIISGCGSYKLYEALGARQSLVDDKVQRKWLFAEYENYQQYLKQHSLLDYSFYRPNLNKRFKLVVVDESQDFSHLQLEVLRDIALGRQICYCEDARQSLTDNLPKRTFFNRLLDAQNQQMSFRELSLTYRCPVSVVNMANNVSKLGARLSGQRQPAVMQLEDQARDGQVVWLDAVSAASLQDLNAQANSPDFAVVTLPELKSEACTRFATQLVFTVEEIKGLEYQTVLVYRLLDTDLFYQANNAIAKIEEKGGQGFTDEKYGPVFNAFYTACTRATHTLLIVQDDEQTRHKLRFITNKLRQEIKKKSEEKIAQVYISNNPEQWFSEVKKQLNEGNIDIARSIYLTKLHKTADEFEQFKRAMLGRQAVKVVASKPAASVRQSQSKMKMNNTPANVVAAAPVAAQKRMTIKELIQYFSAKKLANPAQLFQPIPGHPECQFTYLFDDGQLRLRFMVEYLPKYFDQLAPFMTTEALCRRTESSELLSPLCWICKDESTLYRLEKSQQFIPKLAEVFASDAFIKTLDIDSGQVSTHPLYWLSCFDKGIGYLREIMERSPAFARYIKKDLLFTKCNGMYGRPLSMFNNLYLSTPGITVLKSIMAVNFEIIASITIRDLFPPVPVHEMPRIHRACQDKQNGEFIRLIRKHNTLVAEFLGDELSPAELITLDEKLNEQVIEERHVKTVHQLLSAPTKENIEVIFSHKNAHMYLFDIKLHDGECLFTWLFDRPETRNIVLETMLPKYATKLTLFVRCQALSRCNNSQNAMPPPLLWLAGSEKCAKILVDWFTTNKRLIVGISSESALSRVTCEQYIKAGLPKDYNALFGSYKPVISKDMHYSALTLSLLSRSGMAVFAFLIKTALLWRVDVVTELSHIRILDGKKQITAFDLITRSEMGVIGLKEIIQRASELQKMAISCRLTDCEVMNEDQATGHSPLVNLLDYAQASAILDEFLKSTVLAPDKSLVNQLFSGFRSNVRTDATSLLVLRKLYLHGDILKSLTEFLKLRPRIIADFDRDIFLSEAYVSVDSVVRAEQLKAIERINRTPEGKCFIDFIKNVLQKNAFTIESSENRFFASRQGGEDGVCTLSPGCNPKF